MSAPRWMSQATSEEFSWSQALGGTRGVIEATAPGLIFVIVYVATHALTPTLVAASSIALIACIIRLISVRVSARLSPAFLALGSASCLQQPPGAAKTILCGASSPMLPCPLPSRCLSWCAPPWLDSFTRRRRACPRGGAQTRPCVRCATAATSSHGCGPESSVCAPPSKRLCGLAARSLRLASLSSHWACRSLRSAHG